ncbi:UNVERIFIED_CONTAM: hypothetical protein K2H54_027221 [Gekko kuhli]
MAAPGPASAAPGRASRGSDGAGGRWGARGGAGRRRRWGALRRRRWRRRRTPAGGVEGPPEEPAGGEGSPPWPAGPVVAAELARGRNRSCQNEQEASQSSRDHV